MHFIWSLPNKYQQPCTNESLRLQKGLGFAWFARFSSVFAARFSFFFFICSPVLLCGCFDKKRQQKKNAFSFGFDMITEHKDRYTHTSKYIKIQHKPIEEEAKRCTLSCTFLDVLRIGKLHTSICHGNKERYGVQTMQMWIDQFTRRK